MNKRLTEGTDFYYSAGGLIVFTSSYHLKRGKCCGTGCMHCPYDYENVSELKKTDLKNERPAVILLKVPDSDKKDNKK